MNEGKDIKKEILNDDFIKKTATEMKSLFGKTDKRSMIKKEELMNDIVKHLLSKLPNAVDFVNLLDSDKPKMGIEKIIEDEDIKAQIIAVGNFYNMISAKIKAEKGIDFKEFRDYIEVLFTLSFVLEYMRKYRPDLYIVLTDVEMNNKKCILGKFNEALYAITDNLKKLPYKKYKVKRR